MPRTIAAGHDGAITMPAAHGGDVFSWQLAVAARNKDVTPYGSGRYSKWQNGLFDSDINLGAFLTYGATLSSPGLYSMAVAGSTLTLTAATGCTYSGVAIFTNGTIAHNVGDPGIPLNYQCKFSGTVTETWAMV